MVLNRAMVWSIFIQAETGPGRVIIAGIDTLSRPQVDAFFVDVRSVK
jgi:hypothetical protein